MSTATTQTRWKRTRAGEWVVCGPSVTVRPGATVTVASHRGDRSVLVTRVGRAFDLAGVEHVYGYPAPKAASAGATSSPADECWECGRRRRHLVDLPDSSGIVGPVCPTCAAGPACTRSYA